MSKCPEPGEPGFNEAAFLLTGVNVGIWLARQVGLGLPLVNALTDRFPGIDPEFAGRLAGIVGQGVREGVGLTTAADASMIDPGSVPHIGPDAFRTADPAERFQVRGTVGWLDDEGVARWNTFNIYATEADTIGSIRQQLLDQFYDTAGSDSAIADQAPPDPSGLTLQFWFVGSRF
jgi:hypothetical protein